MIVPTHFNPLKTKSKQDESNLALHEFMLNKTEVLLRWFFYNWNGIGAQTKFPEYHFKTFETVLHLLSFKHL